MSDQILTIVFGDDRADRLAPLTQDRVKAAMPFGGVYRIIDFVLTNCLHSGLRRILVLASGRSHSLYTHLRDGWSVFNPALGEYVAPFPTPAGGRRTLAESLPALRASAAQIERSGALTTVVLVGGHLYRMDYDAIIRAHRVAGADVTVGTVQGRMTQGSTRPCLSMEGEQVRGLQPVRGGSRRRETAAALELPRLMGVYVFSTPVLLEALAPSAEEGGRTDFTEDFMGGLVQRRQVMGYAFGGVSGRVSRDQYWAELDTLDSYFSANLGLLEPVPPIDLYQTDWPVWSHAGSNPPARTAESPTGNEGLFVNSVVSSGTVIIGAAVSRSVIGRRVRVEDSATVERSVLFDDVQVGEGAQIRNCIVDRGARIPAGDRIGFRRADDEVRLPVTPDGVAIVPRDYKGSVG